MAPLTRSLGGRAFGVNWAKLLVTLPCFLGWPAPFGQSTDPKYPDSSVQRQRYGAADMNVLARFLDALSVKTDVALIDNGLRKGAALEQPNEEQEPVDPHFLSLASSANA